MLLWQLPPSLPPSLSSSVCLSCHTLTSQFPERFTISPLLPVDLTFQQTKQIDLMLSGNIKHHVTALIWAQYHEKEMWSRSIRATWGLTASLFFNRRQTVHQKGDRCMKNKEVVRWPKSTQNLIETNSPGDQLSPSYASVRATISSKCLLTPYRSQSNSNLSVLKIFPCFKTKYVQTMAVCHSPIHPLSVLVAWCKALKVS